MSTCARLDALDELLRPLLPEEEAERDAHLATCRGCAALRDLGPTLRADTAPGAEDEALLAAALLRARERASRTRRRARVSAAMLIAAVLVVASGAFAAWSALSTGDEAAVGSPPREPSAAGLAEPGVEAQPTPEAVAGPSSAAEVSPAPPATDKQARRPPPASMPSGASSVAPAAAPAPTPTTEPEDAAALLAQANAHRRRGENQEAIARYRALAARFPGSREEVSSRVMFGNLLLDSDATAALERFDAYLAAGAAALAEEAWLGKAQALERLGREADARQAWAELLRRFPATVHGERARSRLGAP